MDKKEVLRKLKIFSDVVAIKYSPLKIVLFGSYAKGNFTIDSDIDVAVIVENIEGSFLDREAELYKIRRNIDENIEPVLFLAGTDKSGFFENILSYGEVVYERQGEAVI